MSDANILIGKYFHSFTNDGGFKWQGKIVGQINNGAYVVQLFEWFLGQDSVKTIVKIDDMYDWVIYETDEDMREAYSSKQAKPMRHENDPHHQP